MRSETAWRRGRRRRRRRSTFRGSTAGGSTCCGAQRRRAGARRSSSACRPPRDRQVHHVQRRGAGSGWTGGRRRRSCVVRHHPHDPTRRPGFRPSPQAPRGSVAPGAAGQDGGAGGRAVQRHLYQTAQALPGGPRQTRRGAGRGRTGRWRRWSLRFSGTWTKTAETQPGSSCRPWRSRAHARHGVVRRRQLFHPHGGCFFSSRPGRTPRRLSTIFTTTPPPPPSSSRTPSNTNLRCRGGGPSRPPPPGPPRGGPGSGGPLMKNHFVCSPHARRPQI